MSEYQPVNPIRPPRRPENEEVFRINLEREAIKSGKPIGLSELGRRARDNTAKLIRLKRTEERARVAKQEAEIDPLTGFLNRKGFEAKLEEEAKRARRSSSPLTIMFFDLNGLKEVNDTQGHESGDKLIKMATEIIAEGREYDRAARWGGDEFAKILPETSEAEAKFYWERINKEFQDKGVSIVAGMIQVDPSNNDTVKESWRLCDLAEKEAKKKSHVAGGKNIMLNARDLPNEIILAA